MGWYNTLIAGKYTSTGLNQKKRGCPTIAQELIDEIVKNGSQNINWAINAFATT